MQTKFDIGQKVFYVYKRSNLTGWEVFEGFVWYIKAWAQRTDYGITETLSDPEYKCEVPEYAIGLTEREAVRSHYTHRANEYFKKLEECHEGIKSGKLKEAKDE